MRGGRAVGAAFLAHAVAFGVLTSISSLLRTLAVDAGANRSLAAFATSVPVFLVLGLSGVAGRIADVRGSGRVMAVGSVVAGIALCVGSAAADPVVGLLLVCTPLGLGMSGLFVPSLRQVELTSPAARRASAIGLAAAGTSVGTLVLPPVALTVAESHGVRWVLLGLGLFVLLGGLGASYGASSTAPRPPASAGSVSAIPRSLLTFGWSISMAYYVPLAYMVAAAADSGISRSGLAALLVLVGTTNLVGRVGAGRLYTGRSGRAWLAGTAAGLAGSMFLLALTSTESTIVFLAACVYGASSGGLVVTLTTVALESSSGTSPGLVIGIVYRSLTVGALAGPTFVGWWFDTFDSYTVAFLVVGAVCLAGVAFGSSGRPSAVEAGTGDNALV